MLYKPDVVINDWIIFDYIVPAPNEIPLLYQLINTLIYSKLTNEQQPIQFEDIKNYVIQYVDDSSSIISTSDISSLDKFVDCYLRY